MSFVTLPNRCVTAPTMRVTAACSWRSPVLLPMRRRVEPTMGTAADSAGAGHEAGQYSALVHSNPAEVAPGGNAAADVVAATRTNTSCLCLILAVYWVPWLLFFYLRAGKEGI